MDSMNLVTLTSSQPIYFQGPAHFQNCSLPDSIIYYITKNPSSSKLYQKLVQLCKFFFIKNPVIVLPCLHYTYKGWKICSKKCSWKRDRIFDINIISRKLWVTNTLDLLDGHVSTPLSYISRLYRCDIGNCYLSGQTLSMDELLFLAASSTKLILSDSYVTDDKGSIVYVEIILSNLPKIIDIQISSNVSYISNNTVQNLFALPHFSKIKFLRLTQIPDSFDIESILEYLKKTSDFILMIDFCSSISNEYRHRLEAFVDELLATESTTFRFPILTIPNSDQNKLIAMIHRFYKSSWEIL